MTKKQTTITPKPTTRKLTVDKPTLNELSSDELDNVAGGVRKGGDPEEGGEVTARAKLVTFSPT